MSRSAYSDDCEHLALYRKSVERALHGKRGQAFLRRLLTALDAMPEKRLIADGFITSDGCCAMGSIAQHEAIELPEVNDDDHDAFAKFFDIAPSMVAEVAFINDEMPYRPEPPEERWVRMRTWVASQISEVEP